VNKEEKKLSNVATAGIMIAAFLLLWSLARNAFPVYHRVSPWSLLETTELSAHTMPDPNITGGPMPDKYAAFRNCTSVEAKVLRIFADEYMFFPQYGYRCHVMELLVVDVIAGNNVPRIVYCAFPEEWTTEVQPFQTMVVALQQWGLGPNTLINSQKKTVETFGNLFKFYMGGYYVIPIKNGMIDVELMNTNGWGYCCDCGDSDDEYPAHAGRTLAEIKQAIRTLAATATEESVVGYEYVSPENIQGWRAKLLYRYVSDPTVGVFYQGRTNNGLCDYVFGFHRYINGKNTEEYVLFYVSDGKIVDAEYKGKYAKWFPFLQVES